MESNTTIIEGEIHVLGQEQRVSETSQTTKQQVVVKTDGQHTQYIPVDFINGKCGNELAILKPGDRIKITANIGGREYNNPTKGMQYFLSVNGWKVESPAISVGRAGEF